MVMRKRHTTLCKRVEVGHHVFRHVIRSKAVQDEKQMLVRRVWFDGDDDTKRQEQRQGSTADHLFGLREESAITDGLSDRWTEKV